MATPPQPAPSRIGTFRIEVDGEWDIEDLRDVSEGLSEAYGLLYPLVADTEERNFFLQASLSKFFWGGDMESRFIGAMLYRSIPLEESLRLKSFQYSSQGAITIVGVLSVLYLMARVTMTWTRTAEGIIELWGKIDKFFEKRRHLRRPQKQFELDSEMALNVEEARALVFEVGGHLGFTHNSCDVLINIIGNPIGALKFLVAVGQQGRKMAELQREGKLRLPEPTDDQIELPPPGRGRRRQVEVVRKRRKKTPPAPG
jgi:hypothetical protein